MCFSCVHCVLGCVSWIFGTTFGSKCGRWFSIGFIGMCATSKLHARWRECPNQTVGWNCWSLVLWGDEATLSKINNVLFKQSPMDLCLVLVLFPSYIAMDQVRGDIQTSCHPPCAEEQPLLSAETAVACSMAQTDVGSYFFVNPLFLFSCCDQQKVFEEILWEQRKFRENARISVPSLALFLLSQEVVLFWRGLWTPVCVLNQPRSQPLLRWWRFHGASKALSQKGSSMLHTKSIKFCLFSTLYLGASCFFEVTVLIISGITS